MPVSLMCKKKGGGLVTLNAAVQECLLFYYGTPVHSPSLLSEPVPHE